MALAPEPYRSACLSVLEAGILSARADCWAGTAAVDRVADLMDALHNIPAMLRNWESCDVTLLRRGLIDFDRRWPGVGANLCQLFDSDTKGG